MPFGCEQCGREFQNEEGLAQHNRDKHSIGKEGKAEKMVIEQQAKKEQKESELEKSIKTKKMKRIVKYSIFLIIMIVLLYFVISSLGSSSPLSRLREGMGPLNSDHKHADIKAYLDGRAVDFSQPKYQVKAQHVHMEGGDGVVIHMHATGVRLGYFLYTLGMKFNQTCFTIDKADYCSNSEKALKFLVNGVPNDEWEYYALKSMDKILISYGRETNLTSQLNSITSKGVDLDTGRATLPMGRV